MAFITPKAPKVYRTSNTVIRVLQAIKTPIVPGVPTARKGFKEEGAHATFTAPKVRKATRTFITAIRAFQDTKARETIRMDITVTRPIRAPKVHRTLRTSITATKALLATRALLAIKTPAVPKALQAPTVPEVPGVPAALKAFSVTKARHYKVVESAQRALSHQRLPLG